MTTTTRKLVAIVGLLTWAALVGAVLAFAEVPESTEPLAIPNYRVVRPGLATGGQPSAETLTTTLALPTVGEGSHA